MAFKDQPISIFREMLEKAKKEEQEKNARLSDIFGPLLPPPLPPLLPEPLIIRDRWYKDENIHIDMYTFERCRFDRCNFITENATYVFRNCFISRDCKLFFKGPSLKVVRLMMHYLRITGRVSVMEGEEGVYATLNPDGTFSLE
jgi:hypothetical protein